MRVRRAATGFTGDGRTFFDPGAAGFAAGFTVADALLLGCLVMKRLWLLALTWTAEKVKNRCRLGATEIATRGSQLV